MSRISRLPAEVIQVPGEPEGNRLHFKPITESQMQDSAAGALKETQERMGMSSQEMQAMAKDVDVDDPAIVAQREQRADDPLAGYSQLVLLQHGLVGWEGERYSDANTPYPKDGYQDLTPDVERWAALQVLRISEIAQGELSGSVAGTGSSAAADGADPIRELTGAGSRA